MKESKIINFSGKQANWDRWSKKIFTQAKPRGYKGLLLRKDNIPMQEPLDLAEVSSSDSDKRMLKLGEVNELAFKDIMLSITHTTA